MNDKIEFKVGNEYENVKGVYKVISINGDSMIIQWENGEQISTPIDFQRRIIERIQREKEESEKKKVQQQQKGKKHGRTKYSSKFGAEFIGFKESDFKKNVAGTNWRSRSFLGGAVTERFYSNRYNFNSWATYRIPAVHWQDMKHREQAEAWLMAKFVARVDENNLYYGFYIERSNKPADVKNDWNRFISWLKDAKNENWLNEIASAHDLSIYDIEESGFPGTIQSSNGGWERNLKTHDEQIISLSDFLDKIPKELWIDLYITKNVDKVEVLEKGEDIANDISELFEILMPLYIASTAHVT